MYVAKGEKLFEQILNNQLGNFDWKTRNETIQGYHKRHPSKCPKCGSPKIGITYTTGTGACSCGASLMLTTRGIVANMREKKVDGSLGSCHLYFEDGTELECKETECKLGPVFCGKVNHICL